MIRGDGSCGLRTTTTWVHQDQSLGPYLARNVNQYFVENWEFGNISSPILLKEILELVVRSVKKMLINYLSSFKTPMKELICGEVRRTL